MTVKLLLVDDDERVLRTFARNLALEGYHVLTTSSGAEAIELYASERPDITLVDMRMPGVDGFDVLEAIRAIDPDAEIILTTGHGDKDMVIQALRAGASDFIPKPVDGIVLEAALARAQERMDLKRSLLATQAALRASEARFRKRAADLEMVSVLSAAVTRILDTEQLLQRVANLTRNSFHLYHVHIYLLDASRETLAIAAGAGAVTRQIVAQGWQISLDREDSLVAQAARSQQSIIVNDVSQSPNFLPNPLLPDTRSEMAVPMAAGGAVLGVLDVQSDAVNRFTEADAHIFNALAAQVAVALRNATLFAERECAEAALREAHDALEQQVQERTAALRRANDQLRRRNHELSLLNRAGRAFSSSLDLRQVLDALLEEVRELLGAMGCSVWLISPETGELVCEQLIGPKVQRVLGWRMPPDQGLAGWVVQHGESLMVPDATQDPRHFSGVDQTTGLDLRSILTVPLRVRHELGGEPAARAAGQGRVFGVIQMVDTEAARFNARDVILLESLAASAAIAIENARLYGMAQERLKREM